MKPINALKIASFSALLVAATTLSQAAQQPQSAQLNNDEVKSIQNALNKDGYNVKVDGKFGKQTQAAIKQYQQDQKLPATGQPDDATKQKLGVE